MSTGLKSTLTFLFILMAVTRSLSQVESQEGSSHCPLGALQIVASEFVQNLNWKRVRSDEQAVACLRELASDLGPEKTKSWLEQSDFSAVFIKSFIPGDKEVLLSASWPIKRKGLLYYPGATAYLQARFFAYSQVFSFRWDEHDRLLGVRQSRVLK